MTTPQEIWSVRLQREILALTTPPTPTPDDKDVVEGKDDTEPNSDDASSPVVSGEAPPPTGASGNNSAAKNANSTIGILPPFLSVEKHDMDIENGICKIWFEVEVPSAVVVVHHQSNDAQKDDCHDVNAADSSERTPSPVPPSDAATSPLKPTKTPNDVSLADEPPTEPGPTPTPSPAAPPAPAAITILIDASLPRPNPTHSDPRRSQPATSVNTYPFSKPTAILYSGAVHLPAGSTLRDGDDVNIDCDWTPSLHLRDAALNVALKLREGIRKNEPIHRDEEDDEMEKDIRIMGEALSQGVSQGTQKMKSFFQSVKDKAVAVADELDKAVIAEKEDRLRKQTAMKKDGGKKANVGKVVDGSNVEIGDVINLAMNPWCQAVGMHPCKAIRRPQFVEAALKSANANKKGKEVAGSGVSATGSFFQTFRQNAKSLVEESFLMLTPDHILEITCNKFSVATATVTYAIPVSSLAKLKFRRQESISLFFRQAPDDPAIYLCDTSADAVKELQGILKKYGVKGKHTNATMQRCVKTAIEMIDEIQAREIELEIAGEMQNRRVMVENIMDLYRQAAEKLELAGDVRHEEVMVHMHEFLAKPVVAEILDSKSAETGYYQKSDEPVPDGEILDSLDGEKGEESAGQESDDFHRAMQAAEDMLKDAHDDLQELGIDDEVDAEVNLDDKLGLDDLNVAGSEDLDVVSEFEDMLKDADKELAELMGS